MKLVFILVLLVPFAVSVPEKRNLNEILSAVGKFLHVNEIKSVVQTIVDTIGTQESEATCEAACPTLFHNSIMVSACKVACKGTNELAHHFHITPTQ